MIELQLANGKGVALVDDEDSWAGAYSWHVHVAGTKTYARTWVDGRREYLHRMILRDVELVDHVNGDGLDNRRENLRAADRSLNSLNSAIRSDNRTGEKNICWHAGARKYLVEFRRRGVTHYVGLFETVADAVEARDEAIRRVESLDIHTLLR